MINLLYTRFATLPRVLHDDSFSSLLPYLFFSVRFKFKAGHLFQKEKLSSKMGYSVNISDIEKKLLQKSQFRKERGKRSSFSKVYNLKSVHYIKLHPSHPYEKG